MKSALIALLTVIATLPSPSNADLYRYRTPVDGKLVISNQPPPPGARVESTRASSAPSLTPPAGSNVESPSEPTARRAPQPAPEPTLGYVDLHPLEVDSAVQDSEVYWKKFVTGRVKNRSGITTATGITVTTACTLGGRPVDGGTAHLGTLGPRGSAGFQIPIILHVREYFVPGKGWFAPQIGRVSCDTEVTYTKL